MKFPAQLEAVWCSLEKKQASSQATVSLGADEVDPPGPAKKMPSFPKEPTRNELRKNGKRSYQ
jgi:hypothetical protein